MRRENTIADRITSSSLWRSIVRHGYPDTQRNQALIIATNVFLHLHPVKIKRYATKVTYTFCLGGLSFFMFLVLTVTGVLLMFYYVPSVDRAYQNMKDIETSVTFGQLMRNMHRWAAHGHGDHRLPAHVPRLLHRLVQAAARVQLGRRRRPALVTTFLLSFTGYLLPWDQLALWAITVGTNIGGAAPLARPARSTSLLRRRLRGRPERADPLLHAARHLPAAGRGDPDGRPLLAHPQGRRHLRPAVRRQRIRKRSKWRERG